MCDGVTVGFVRIAAGWTPTPCNPKSQCRTVAAINEKLNVETRADSIRFGLLFTSRVLGHPDLEWIASDVIEWMAELGFEEDARGITRRYTYPRSRVAPDGIIHVMPRGRKPRLKGSKRKKDKKGKPSK